MEKKCLKCGYERQSSDASPDYQCPKCGAVYAKVEVHLKERQKKSDKRTKQCPYCAEEIKLGASVCPHCKRSFISTDPQTNAILYVVFSVIIFFVSYYAIDWFVRHETDKQYPHIKKLLEQEKR
jgi:predicted Zn-ribbon and HTH transcriptional regulator